MGILMKKIKENIFLVAFVILMVIPQTRLFMQVQLQKVIGYFNQPKIEEVFKGNVQLNGHLLGLTTKNKPLNGLKGKVVVINYWATWCPPCVAEMPSFQKLYNTYKANPDIVFLFITSDDKKRVQQFVDKGNYTLPIYYDNQQLFSELTHNSIPTTFILNRQAEIKVKKTGAVQWNSQKVYNIISKLLSK